MKLRILFLIVPLAVSLVLAGCSRSFYGGAAAGAVGAGAAYEYQAHEAIENLDEDLKAGRISQEEYDRRKREIEKRSLTQ